MNRNEGMKKRNGTHDEVRDRIARSYFHLPPLKCRFCKYETPLPIEGVDRVATEHRHRRFRADVAALNQRGQIIAVVEVVNTNRPSDETLDAQSELESAFYVTLDALDDGFAGYCSHFCWTHRGEENALPWSPPACGNCERFFHTMEFQWQLYDWEQSSQESECMECAARRSGGQWRSPGDIALGDPEDRIPGPNADAHDLFLAFEDADFWAMVWTNRTSKPSEARTPETQTAARLDQVEAAFDSGDWHNGQRLLQPIGAPPWDRPPGPALFAWNHDNCVRTALAWRRLREHRLGCLPPSIQAGIQSRPPLEDVVTDIAKVVVIHRGFPDGRFTACGIDRETCEEPIEATMTGNPTCRLCR